jgi:hypothetical protein
MLMLMHMLMLMLMLMCNHRIAALAHHDVLPSKSAAILPQDAAARLVLDAALHASCCLARQVELYELQHSHKSGTLALRKVAQLCSRPWKLLEELTSAGTNGDRKVAVTLATLVCNAIPETESVDVILRNLDSAGKADSQMHVSSVRVR